MPVLKNPKHERFAREYAKTANGKQSYIAAGYSAKGAEVSASQLLRHPKVSARIAEISAKVTESVVKLEIGRRSNRVAALQERWLKMRQIIAERAEHRPTAKAPGGSTGLLCVTKKAVAGKVYDEFAFDAALVREMRGTEEQAARELGQWVEKQAKTDADGNNLPLMKLPDELLAQLIEAASAYTEKA